MGSHSLSSRDLPNSGIESRSPALKADSLPTEGLGKPYHSLSSVQSLSRVQLFATPWTAARQASLSITNSEFTQTHVHWVSDAIQPSHPLSSPSPSASIFPRIRVFWNESFFALGGQSIGVSASTSVLPMNIQDRFPLGWTGWISLQSNGLSREGNGKPLQHSCLENPVNSITV